MYEFFFGWRRRAGLVTLAIALLFMGAWVRSQSIEDQFELFKGKYGTHRLESLRVGLCWVREFSGGTESSEPEIVDWFGFKSGSVAIVNFDCGFTFNRTFWIIPFWSVICPLTLVSAYLLIVKSGSTRLDPVVKTMPESALPQETIRQQ